MVTTGGRWIRSSSASVHVFLLERVFRGFMELEFQLHAEFGRDEVRGFKIQLVVDRRDHAEHHQLLDDLARRLADALGRGRAR